MLKTLFLSLAWAACAFAQWPNFPSKNVPLKDGKPDLAAAAPRTAWGTPDLSGVWENARGPVRAGEPPFTVGPPVGTFANVGAAMKGGLPFRSWAAELIKERHSNHSKNNPDALCLPMGLTQLHMHSQPRKMIQSPELIVIIYEANAGMRQIFMDGRALPGPEADAWWYGYSVGHWEGDTLVVETVRLKDMGWLDIWGSPITENAKMIERYRRTDFGQLEIDVTIEDLAAYTAPFTFRVNQRVMLNTDLIEFICGENDKFTTYLRGAGER